MSVQWSALATSSRLKWSCFESGSFAGRSDDRHSGLRWGNESVQPWQGCMCIFRSIVLCSLCVIALVGCGAPPSDAGAQRAPQSEAHPERLQPPLGLDVDAGVLETFTPSRIRLGRSLFFDRRLSADGTISCATIRPATTSWAASRSASIRR